MTPLAAKVARDLSVPRKARIVDDCAGVLALFGQDMHCFDISALSKSINAVLDYAPDDPIPDASWSVWRDVGSMLPAMFLPSPVTWLETVHAGERFAIVLRQDNGRFVMDAVFNQGGEVFSIAVCDFKARGVFEVGERIDFNSLTVVKDKSLDTGINWSKLGSTAIAAKDVETVKAARNIMKSLVDVLDKECVMARRNMMATASTTRFISMAILALDLINTPGLIGLKQREINRSLARSLANVGRYPLQTWSEVVLKHEMKVAQSGEQLTGATFRKCLHFVRSHLRHYVDGRTTVIPAHWRGDAALGIKRTRYMVAA